MRCLAGDRTRRCSVEVSPDEDLPASGAADKSSSAIAGRSKISVVRSLRHSNGLRLHTEGHSALCSTQELQFAFHRRVHYVHGWRKMWKYMKVSTICSRDVNILMVPRFMFFVTLPSGDAFGLVFVL